MSFFTQFTGKRSTTSIVNSASFGGIAQTTLAAAESSNGAREVLSGAVTANVLVTVLNITGAGEVPFLTAYAKDVTARTLRAKVTVDGISVFDATSSSITVSGTGLSIISFSTAANRVFPAPSPISFNTSLKVEITSSLTETDKIAIAYILNKF